MATFVTSRPFRGLRQLAYERLLETRPDWVREVSKGELETYLKKLETWCLDRGWELVPIYEKKLGCSQELLASDWAENQRRSDQAVEMARRQATQEMLDSLA